MRWIPTLAEVERNHVLTTLRLCRNNRTHAAKTLGISIRGLRIKLHRYEQDGFEIPQAGSSKQSDEQKNLADNKAAGNSAMLSKHSSSKLGILT